MNNTTQTMEERMELKALQEIWDRSGNCASCGWHSFIREHDVTEEEIIEDLKTTKEKYVGLGCNSYDGEGHRGVFLHAWDFRNLVKLFSEVVKQEQSLLAKAILDKRDGAVIRGESMMIVLVDDILAVLKDQGVEV